MTISKIAVIIALITFISPAFSQKESQPSPILHQDSALGYQYSVSTTWLSFANFGAEKTNTHHYEIHFKYRLSDKNIFGIKVATWKMFAPMGMPMAEQMTFNEDNFYPGRLRETGVGITYQRMLWKGLFATVEILPQLKTYRDANNKNIGNGFKLYTSYHLGYHVPLFKHRMYVEPQIHCQYWPIDTGTPQAFKEKDLLWNNYFLFEPNVYIGVNF